MFALVCNRLAQELEALRRRVANPALLVLAMSIAPPFGSGPFAQEQSEAWTLEDLVAVAVDRNPGLAAARMATSAVEEDIVAARGERMPRVDVVGKGEYFPRRERLLIFRHGFRRDDNPFEDAILNYGLEVRLPLYTSGRIEHGISLAEARAEAARYRAELTRAELIFNVASAYYTALRLQRIVAAQEAALASLGESLRVADLQFNVGRIAPLDLLRIETRVSQAERDLVVARTGHAEILEVLKELLNVPTEVYLDLSDALSPAPTEVAIAELRARALVERPDLIALRHEVRAYQESLGIARSRLGPTVDLKAGYRGVTGLNDGTTRDDAGLFVEFRMPLYEGGVLTAKRRSALARLKEIGFRLDAAERRALAEVERAALDLRASGPRIEAARRAVGQAGESLRVEREKFSRGRGTSNDLLLAEEALLRARTELAAALADNLIALAELRLASGYDPVDVAPGPDPPNSGRE